MSASIRDTHAQLYGGEHAFQRQQDVGIDAGEFPIGCLGTFRENPYAGFGPDVLMIGSV